MITNEQFIERLNDAGVNTQQAIARFMGNEALYLSFIRKLPSALQIQEMYQVLENQEEDTFYMLVHKLKGTAGNLGVETIFEATQAILVEFRTAKFKHMKKLRELLKEVQIASEQFSKILSEYE